MAQPRQPAVAARRERIYEMRKAGMVVEDIARVEGVPASTVKKDLERAVTKLGKEPLEVELSRAIATEVKHPVVAGEAIAAQALAVESDSFRAVYEVCKAHGLPPNVAKALVNRMQTKLSPVLQQARRLTLEQMTEKIEQKLSMIFEYMDDVSMSNAGLKDLAIATGILIEKRELLNKRPTQIIDMTTRMELRTLVPVMMAEARRRGILIDGQAERVEG